MKRTFIAAGVLTAMFVSSLARAEEMQAEVYEHLKPLEWLIGEWVFESQAPDGVKRTITSVWEWTPHKTAIRSEFNIKADGKVTLNGVGMIGWDAAEEAPRSVLFVWDGAKAESLLSMPREHMFESKGTVISPDGETTQMSTGMELMDENTLVSRVGDGDGDGMKFKRVKK